MADCKHRRVLFYRVERWTYEIADGVEVGGQLDKVIRRSKMVKCDDCGKVMLRSTFERKFYKTKRW
jgi:hypothetical protein